MPHPLEDIKKLAVIGATTKKQAWRAIYKMCQQMEELYRKTDKEICVDFSGDPQIEIDLSCDCSYACSHMLDSWLIIINRKTLAISVSTDNKDQELHQVLKEFGMKLLPLVKLIGKPKLT